MFQIIQLQTRRTGIRAVKNRLRNKFGLHVREITDFMDLLETSTLVGRDKRVRVDFPANCLIQVFIGSAEPEPYAQYLAEVKKAWLERGGS